MHVLLVRNKLKKHHKKRRPRSDIDPSHPIDSTQRRQRRFPVTQRLSSADGRQARLRLQLCFIACVTTLLAISFSLKPTPQHEPPSEPLLTSREQSDAVLDDTHLIDGDSSLTQDFLRRNGGGSAINSEKGKARTLESASDFGSFPRDLITERAKDHGAIIVHILVGLYMFYGIAVVCDDFFVSSLEVIIDRLQMKEDVAGATFMAAGGSAPELFTSIIGTFIANSDVGFGTIVGSAVFNVLFVIGICAFGSGQVLNLDWYPLSRDSLYYSFSLLVMVFFVWDQKVELYEAILLFLLYLGYIVVMYFNEAIERKAKGRFGVKMLERRASMSSLLTSKATVLPAPEDSKENEKDGKVGDDAPAAAPHGGDADGVIGGKTTGGDNQNDQGPSVELQPKSEDDIQMDAKSLPPLNAPAMASIESPPSSRNIKPLPPIKLPSMGGGLTRLNSRDSKSRCLVVAQANVDATPQDALESENIPKSSSRTRTHSGSQDGLLANAVEWRASDAAKPLEALKSPKDTLQLPNSARAKPDGGKEEDEDQVRRPSMSSSQMRKNESGEDDGEDENPFEFPDGKLDRFLYFVKVPVLGLLYLTIPDCRKEKYEKYYVTTFLLSLVWIAAFTWLMVWMATEIGITLGIPPPVMGLTVLAAGTSVPDAVSSLVVAKQGFGDMAVSSSIGSNIFDILVGLPIPWIFYAAIYGPVKIDSGSLSISVAVLLAMVVAVILSIHLNAWVLTPRLGFVMVVLYCIFVTISLLLEYNVIPS